MNYAGKFDAAISLDGQGFRSPASNHIDSFTAKAHDHVPDGAVVVADPNLIFHGDFKRTGLDLVLSHDGHEFVVHDYFRGDKRAALASPDGAHLTGDIVSALTGYVQVAQAAPGAAAAAQVIGHVTKLTGSATAVRNGVSVILNNGDNVEKGDVVSTGSDSTLGVTFIDGTVFGLSSNARMVLNEMVYDPNGSNNSSLLSLVAGTITFVAGETAKHGDMKIDTPVATMGIRGTAVLTEINFVVPAGGGDPQPQANFQVLVEPNGTTGSYILFDKLTLLPIATVNQAGQMIQISGGNVSVTNALLSPDIQKLITDVFTLKFTDNNTNTKLTTNFTDTLTQTNDGLTIKTPAGYVAIPIFINLNQQNGPQQGPGDHTTAGSRIKTADSLFLQSLDLGNNVKLAFNLTEVAGQTGVTTADLVIGKASFVDFNLGDRPTVKVLLTDGSYVYQDAGHHDVTASLSALQKQDVLATEVKITVVPGANNDSNGTADWTFSVPDSAFDFLAAGEQLTLKYTIVLNNNFADDPGIITKDITITITGTNDKPVITSDVPTITFSGGTSVPGGPLVSEVPTSGTLTFSDVDLTDTHTVAVSKFSAVLPGGTVPQSIYDFFANDLSVSIASGHDSTGSGAGTINWSLGDIPVYLADFIPKGETLTLTYTVTVTDSQGATSDQTITVTILGTDAPAVVWIATNKPGAPSGGFWRDGANWETGTVPTSTDDVIVITDQLHGLTPSYPVTLDQAAYANSLTMNDFDTTELHTAPEVINRSYLAITQTLTLDADSKLTNLKAGVITVGGKAEFSGTSVLTNAGYLQLAGGGDFAKGTSITNSGSIELSGGTLTTLTETHNTDGTIGVDGATTLIVSATTIDGGIVNIVGTLELDGISLIENGTLNNWGLVKVTGATEFADETVSNTSGGTIRVLADGWLTIDQGSSVTNNGAVTVDASAKLTVNGATIDGAFHGVPDGAAGEDSGGTVTNTGSLTSGTGTVTNNGELDLTGTAVLSNGILKNNGTLNASGAGNALDNEKVTNAGTIEVLAHGALAIDQGSTVDNSNGNIIVDANGALTLDDATISSGAVTGSGSIDVSGASTIDSGATLSVAAVTVDAQLTLDGITVSGSVITDNAGIELDKIVQLKGGAKIQGASADAKGAITNNGTLEIAGAATLLNDVVTNNGTVKVDDDQILTLSGTEITGGIINNYSSTVGGTIAVTGDSTIDGGAALNKGAVTVASDVTLTFGDATVSASKITNSGTVKVEDDKTLTLAGATLIGGALAIAGTLESTGTSGITDADITNTGTITVTGGTLTIDPAALHTLTNQKLLQAYGGELDITGEAIVNTADIKALSSGILRLSTLSVTNDGGTVTVDGTSKLYLTDVSINGGSLNNSGNLYGVSGSNSISGTVTNTGTIEVQAGTLNLSGGVTGVGTLIIDDKATLELGGADAQTVTFAGGTDTLQLDKVAGQSFTGTIAGQASSGGTFKITGNADITTSKGDALDFTASGGSSDSRGDIVLTPTGTLSGANNGIAVTQNGVGSISLTTVGDVTGAAGDGIVLHDGATGAGDITATLGGAASGAVGLDVLANGDGDVTITNNGHITGTSSFGINVVQDGDGATGSTHITNTGSVVGSDGSAAISIHENTTGAATIANSGTIGTDAASVTSTTYAIFETGGAITINNSGHINGDISVATATFDNESGGTWTVSGTSVFGTLSTIDNAGEIDLHDGASVSSLDGATFAITNSGKIESWGTNSITGSITNTNTIEIHTDGTLSLFGSLSGSGSVTIDSDATLVLNATVSQTITFGGDGAELTIKTTDFGGSIAGLVATDKIDLSSIEYGLGTSATYVANADASTGGTLTITDADGHHISLKLTGADYSNVAFAGSDDGTGHTLITYNAADDKPAFNAAETSPAAHLAEQADVTGSVSVDHSTPASGSIHFTDVDLTDRPTATVTDQSATLLDADGHTQLTLTSGQASALESALSVLTSGKNNGSADWSYAIQDSKLDFLGQGQTATVVSTITLDDHHGGTDTAHVTVTITGANDVPVLAGVTTATLVDTAATDSFSDIKGTLVGTDADSGETATLSYSVQGADNHGTATGQYGTLTVHADGSYDYAPNAAAINALSAGPYADTFTIQTTDAHGATGTATFTVNITGANDTPTLADVTTATLVDTAATDSFSDITGHLVGTDADSGETATLSYSVQGADSHGTAAGQYGTLTVNADGSYDYTPDAAAINALSVGNYTDKFTIQTTDAHGATGTATFTVNITGANDTPTITTGAGDVDTATLPETNAGLSKSGTLTVSDADTADHVTVALDHLSVYLDGVLQTDGVDGISNADLVNYLSVQSGDILNGTANHAQFSWDFNSGSQPFDFLAAGHTLSLQYTIVPNDGHVTGTGDVVTINITGSNDSPTLDNATLASVAGNDSNPAGSTVSDLFTGKFHDVDAGASFQAIAVTSDAATTTDGVWQYELAGTSQWVDIGSVSDSHALVLGTDTSIRFVAADGFTGSPDPLGVHALDDTYAGAITTSLAPAIIKITAMSTDGTAPVSDKVATISTEVTAPVGGPIIDTSSFQISYNSQNNTDSLTNLSVTDADPGAATDTFTVTAATVHSNTSVTPSLASGSLIDINPIFQNGGTYDPGPNPPATEQIDLTVTDSEGRYDTVHFIFNKAGDSGQGITLTGTGGKDVIFAASTNDTLTGGGGKDQFVFSPDGGGANASHTITDFIEGLDKIDLRQFSDVSSLNNLTVTQQSHDTMVTWQQQVGEVTEQEQLLLKNVTAATIKSSDFIFHIT